MPDLGAFCPFHGAGRIDSGNNPPYISMISLFEFYGV